MTLRVPTSYRRNFFRERGGTCLRCFQPSLPGLLRCEGCKTERNSTRKARLERAKAKMRRTLAVLTILTLLPLLTLEANAPKTVNGKLPKLAYSKPWYGQASWYGDHWAGRKTACGGQFDPQALTAAHPILPCGTWLRVTNVRTGHSEFAKITDRGPYEEGREIDVSERVAKRIDLSHYGVEQVRLEIVRDAEGKSHPPMEYYTKHKEEE